MKVKGSGRHAVVGALCIGAVFCVSPASGAEIAYGADVGVGYTDNVGRTAANEQDETIASVGADLSLSQSTSRLDAKIASRLEYLDYLDDTFDSEVIGSAVGTASFDIVRERFLWSLEDTFGQTARDQFSPASPANREHVNYFTTGPDITIPLIARTRLRLDGRYSDVYYEDSDLGNERIRGGVALERELSTASSASLRAEVEEVEFDDQTFVDYERQEGFLRYDLSGSRTTFGFDVGYTKLIQAGEESDGALARLNVSRRMSAASTLSFDAGHEFSDAGNAFRQLQTDAAGSTGTQPVQQLADPFTNTYGTLRWNFFRNRTGFALHGGYFDEAYERETQFDRRRLELGASFQRQLSTTMSIHAGGTYSEQDYREQNRKFADVSGTAGLNWQLGRIAYMSFEYLYFDRGDDVANGEYRENQIWLRFGVAGGDRDSIRGPLGGTASF